MAARFAVSFNRLMRWLMTPLGAGPKSSWAEVDYNRIEVQLGWSASAKIDRRAITKVERSAKRTRSWGAHGWGGRWLFNGSSRGVVTLTVDPPQPGRVLVFTLQIRQLSVSLDDPEGFIAAVEAGSHG